MKLKGCGQQWSWPTQSTILEFAHGDEGKSHKCCQDSKFLSPDSNWALPEYQPTALTLYQLIGSLVPIILPYDKVTCILPHTFFCPAVCFHILKRKFYMHLFHSCMPQRSSPPVWLLAVSFFQFQVNGRNFSLCYHFQTDSGDHPVSCTG